MINLFNALLTNEGDMICRGYIEMIQRKLYEKNEDGDGYDYISFYASMKF